ncbi:hypothetical protein [Mesorhizobium sp.]|uniref:hypothetical protein n=1 Tax=Mesorhizobium sp. TaxID=1871066 RepID=UPI0025CBD807|nr:hypothetical protein [Mesorhizobium sp.]
MQATCGLPEHGRVACSICHHPQPYNFDRTHTERNGWRITNNPLAWGGSEPEVVVLGFSKGPTQAGALASVPHDAIAYKGGRSAIAKILHHVGLLQRPDARLVDGLIGDRNGQIHFGSLIRCTVERWDEQERTWKGTGGGMLDRFVATDFGTKVAQRCGSTFLGCLPERTRLIVMLGLGSKLNYVRACRMLFQRIRPGTWEAINEVSYTDGKIVVVHTEHFASQGALLPNWLSGEAHERGRLGLLAREAVTRSKVTGDIGPESEVCSSGSNAKVASAPRGNSVEVPHPVSRNGSASSPSPAQHMSAGHAITLTAGAIRNGNLSLNSVRHLIPPGGIGGTSKGDLGHPFTVRFEPGDSHQTDIAGDKMTFRCRGAVRDFFEQVGARAGDLIRIRAEGSRILVITFQQR